MHVPDFVISSVTFGVFFTLLSWLFNRKRLDGRNIAISIAAFACFMWLNSVTHFTKPLSDAVNAALGIR